MEAVLKDRILHLFFSIDRKQDPDFISRLIKDIFSLCDNYIDLVYCLTGYARDIQGGKGERDIVYSLLYEWYFYDKDRCYELIRSFVFPWKDDSSPLGGWMDARNIAAFVYKRTQNPAHPLLSFCVTLMNQQLK